MSKQVSLPAAELDLSRWVRRLTDVPQKCRSFALLAAILLVGCLAKSSAQDYDDDGYGGQGGNNQGDNDNYGNGYNNDDGYSGNMPNYQQNVDSEGTNNNPHSYNPQGGNDADGDDEGDDGTAAASEVSPSVMRVRRSTESQQATPVADALQAAASEPKLRVKRHGKYYIGPVYTYVKTDKHANFKWGVSGHSCSLTSTKWFFILIIIS